VHKRRETKNKSERKKKSTRRGKQQEAEKGKKAVEDSGDGVVEAEEYAWGKLIKKLKLELKAAEEGHIEDGKRTGVMEEASRMGTNSREQGRGLRRRKKPEAEEAAGCAEISGWT
jgi:hypothetical protein